MTKQNTDYSSTQGVCAHCGSENIKYGSIEPVDESIFYPYDCNDCKKSGKEWYKLNFIDNAPITKKQNN